MKEKLCSLGVSEQEEGCGWVQSPSLVLCVPGVLDWGSGQSPVQAGGVQAGAVGMLLLGAGDVGAGLVGALLS